MSYGIVYFYEAAYDTSGLERFAREVIPAFQCRTAIRRTEAIWSRMTMMINPKPNGPDNDRAVCSCSESAWRTRSEYQGDPGLFGPDSVTWRVIGDVATFVGGIRALLMQAAHQEVAAGVADHSRYQDDPLGGCPALRPTSRQRLSGLPEVDQAVLTVRRAHRPVRGESHRLQAYAADNPGHAAWVHNVLTDSFLVAHQHYGKDKLDERNADRLSPSRTRSAAARCQPAASNRRCPQRLGREPSRHRVSPGMVNAVDFLRRPPLPCWSASPIGSSSGRRWQPSPSRSVR